MKGLTKSIPKGLIHVAGRTLLEQGIDCLIEAGIDSLTIATGWKGEMIKDWVSKLDHFQDIKVIDVQNYEIGPLQTLVTALGVSPEGDTVVCPVDLIISADAIRDTISHHQQNQVREQTPRGSFCYRTGPER